MKPDITTSGHRPSLLKPDVSLSARSASTGNTVQTSTGPIPGLDIERAKRYSRTRLRVFLAGTAISVVRTGWFAWSGRSATLSRTLERRLPDRRLSIPAYAASAFLGSWLADLPFRYLAGYRVERSFALTKQTSGGWFREQLKGVAVGIGFQTVAISGFYVLLRRRPSDWWIILSGLAVPATILGSALVPVLIAPLFNRFVPLDDDEMVGRIKRLGENAGVPIAAVFSMDMSKQTEKANAFFTGLGRTKRIVLGDTLLRDFTPDEIEAVVAHELGHQVHGDIWRLVALGSGMLTASLFVVHRVFPPFVRRTRGHTHVLGHADVASLPMLGLLSTGLSFALSPIQAAISRNIERRTDAFALELTQDGSTYASAMARLASKNLADPNPSSFVVWFLYSHPPVAERIATAETFAHRSRWATLQTDA